MAEYQFNANEVPDDGGDFNGEPLPKGDYPVMAIESELKTTNAGNGKYLDFTLIVIEGPHKDRQLWLKINVENPNQQAVDIGAREYKRLHDAIGIASSTRTDDLHNKPFVARVGFGKGEYKDRNEIKGFKKYGGSPAAVAPSASPAPVAQTVASQPPADGGAVPPWQR